ncbi:MAG: M23 family metallopeptidase [Microgenomates group bacterium]
MPKAINRKYRTGTFISRFFRHTFEHKNIKKMLGANLAALAITSTLLPQTTNVLAQGVVNEPIIEAQTNLITEKGIQYPTSTISITQRYSFFHPGIDLDGLTGEPIKPIKTGKVLSVQTSKFGYGNEIIIDHGNQLISLYAHLSKIEVKKDQVVNMDTELGKMGATGHASGDHLHLEVHDHGKAINPLSVLPR